LIYTIWHSQTAIKWSIHTPGGFVVTRNEHTIWHSRSKMFC